MDVWMNEASDRLSDLAIKRSTRMRDALTALDRAGTGILLLVDDSGRLERTVTDGDLRRQLLGGRMMDDDLADLPGKEPVVIREGASRKDALELMDARQIDQLPVLDLDGRVVDLLERREIDKQILLSTPHMGSSEMEFIEEAFRTNWIAPLGPNVDAFERETAAIVGIGHAAALASGTAALHLALRLLDVGAGDRVFCSSLTFAASANPIVYQNAEPVFIDSEPESWNMSPRALERALEAARAEGWRPAALIVVNLYGQSADMDPIIALCDRYGVPVVEDAAESLGATYKGRPSGSFGRLSVLSFNGNKIITTSGGGMLMSDDEALIKRARFLSTQAREPVLHYEHKEIGYNYRMSNLLAGVGRGQLQVLGERVAARRKVFETYRQGLADVAGIEWMPEPEWSVSTHWLSTCTIDPRAVGMSSRTLLAALAGEMIETRPLWKPMHLQPVFAGARYFEHGNESVSDGLYETGLCLPSGSNLSAAEVERIVATIRRVIGA
jgi:dTDP-4-amino-4,6-dideoxygalactose transaminase